MSQTYEYPTCFYFITRFNRYHTCVEYCLKRWGSQKFEPPPTMLKKRDRMLKRYPLPEGWEEVADPLT